MGDGLVAASTGLVDRGLDHTEYQPLQAGADRGGAGGVAQVLRVGWRPVIVAERFQS